ncbi:MAG: hypothetical protein H0W73_01920 [Bacteroidetes bacterium]|nr:hypothetical protein [Bacteroidota bacterium]
MKFFLYLFLLLTSFIFGQKDSLSSSNILKPGIYLTFGDFKANKPLPFDSISFKDDNKTDNILAKLKKNTSVNYIKNGKAGRINSSFIWGFTDDKKLYVNFNSTFNKASYVGSICTFFSYITKMQDTRPGSRDAKFQSYKAFALFIMNFEDGIAVEATPKKLSKLLKKDPLLFQEYDALDKDKKHNLMEGFVKRFNEANPSIRVY